MASNTRVSCGCGATWFELTALVEPSLNVVEMFICHCTMCPLESRCESYGGGAPWCGVSTRQWYGTFEKVWLSPFASRVICRQCQAPLSIAYDCEENTEWVHAKVLNNADILNPRFKGVCMSENGREYDTDMHGYSRESLSGHHIHCASLKNLNNSTFSDGRPAWPKYEPWEADVCRPQGMPPPHFCDKCFQLDGKCGCLVDRPNSADDVNCVEGAATKTPTSI